MFRNEMPRVYELIDLIHDPSTCGAYFQNFDKSNRDEPLKKQVWLAREREFQRLDLDSWQFLKSEALPYLTTRDDARGWQQLISILNQARAHNYLIDAGCLQVGFIPRARNDRQKTPDLKGMLDGRKVLCEVKTVNISDEETIRRKTGGLVKIADALDVGFFKKLRSDLLIARGQMESYDGSTQVRRIALLVLNFDDLLAEYKENYFKQIDKYLATEPVDGIDIVFYNQRTAFHVPVVMSHASVVNES
jgi:hypothetical protein